MSPPGGRVGIDLGGTRLKAGRVNAAGQVIARRVVEPDADARHEAGAIATLCDIVAAVDPAGTLPVGVAVAGVVDRAAGTVRQSPNFPAWRDFALGRRLAAATGRQILLDNDANAVIVGEHRYGAARGVDDLIGLTLGTGVGGAVVLNGVLWAGPRGMAGELGHMTVHPNGRPCGCGNRGCLEQYAGAVGLRQSMREAGGKLAALAPRSDAPEQLAALADSGSAPARAIFTEAGRALGQITASLIHALDVRCLVLAGGVSQASRHLLGPLEDEVRARTFSSMRAGFRVLLGALGEDAGIVGAAALAGAGIAAR